MPLLAPKLFRFGKRILTDFFFHNNGLLLTSAVAYNALLSLVPLSTVIIVVFSKFFDEGLLLETINAEVALIAPGATTMLDEILNTFIETRELVGIIGVGVLLFFSSVAFRVLENAIGIIFHRPKSSVRRKFWVSALLPYGFIGLIAVGLISVTSLTSVFESVGFGHAADGTSSSVDHFSTFFVRSTGWLGLVLLFTTLYVVMPTTKISFRIALAGGVTAAILWEGLRYLLTAYYTHISFVNAVYGSMATTIIALLTMEAAALIVLLGAQVIADLQRSRLAGKPWHQDPDDPPA